ncbi:MULTISPECIES: sigma-70 family RNA polymerase sigma factor [unclassified Mesorhizobium]|uniref:sigma-70 family RNA polymerase sigma factor n=1 Tax=unclassified Mesorhizobium TaxID=325217 RepID=UPI00112CE95F|nr:MULTISPECIES: sigma-70 family RNA polymerase sigma factor [unclassified Mesorhizobium]MBZ9974305.1 sigma-70 family RNA polymerase sigma factor [Mesorhizobium sp. BR-1-1-10]TPK10208.1 sigma-70 family RNA polymerase sigma factor [Mesorhizobium sp. B2-5-7]
MKVNFDVTPHLEDLWRYSRVLTKNDTDADDLVQEALVRALGLSRTYDASRPLMPWLITIVRNTFFTSAVRADAERRRLAAYAQQCDPLLMPSQEHCAELSNVQRALEGLPSDQAEVLHLVAVLGFTYSDAAAVLGVPVGTVMSRLSRARIALKHNMEKANDAARAQLKIVGGRDVAK